MKGLILVGLGGAVGTIIRYLLQRTVNMPLFPYGTLFVNLAGCFFIGLLWGAFKGEGHETGRLLLMTGFCGGFTTFSAITLESLQMMNEEKWFHFFMYVLISVCGGLLATFLGYKIIN